MSYLREMDIKRPSSLTMKSVFSFGFASSYILKFVISKAMYHFNIVIFVELDIIWAVSSAINTELQSKASGFNFLIQIYFVIKADLLCLSWGRTWRYSRASICNHVICQLKLFLYECVISVQFLREQKYTD